MIEDNSEVLFLDDTGVPEGDLGTNNRKASDQATVNEDQSADDGKTEEPEPQNEIHLVVDRVEEQKAHGFVLLHVT